MGLIIRNLDRRWPGGCIPYTVIKETDDPSRGVDAQRQQAINDAIRHWEEKTQFNFIRRQDHHDFVTFQLLVPSQDAAGSSPVGRQGGQQPVFLNDDNDQGAFTGNVIHEIGHAVGIAHEHQRADRADFIQIDRSKYSGDDASFDRNYGVRSDSQWERVGDYDFCSIMHYGNGSGVITARDATLPCATNFGQRTELKPLDMSSAVELLGGRAEICRMSAAGQFEQTVSQMDLGSGYNVCASYNILGIQYVLRLKTTSGRGRVQPVDAGGALGDSVQDFNWTDGWTHAVPYSVGASNYLLIYKAGGGRLHLHRLAADGRIGERIAQGTISSGFTSILHFNILTSNYMFFLRSSDGKVEIRPIEWNGLIPLDRTIDTRDWTSGWTTALTYKIGTGNFLFLMKRSSGLVHVHALDADGRVGRRVDTVDLDRGFTNAAWLPVAGTTYLLLNNSSTGRVKTYRVHGDGRLAEKVDERAFRSGINSLTTYGSMTSRYLLMIRS
jgi:Astacin (Peptidase family M12A)